MNQAITSSVPKKRSKFKRIFIIFFLCVLLGFIIYYLVAGITYSEGTRSGVLTKVSKKGFVFKTYEGEMNVGGFSQGDGTVMPSKIFIFSVGEKAVYDSLEQMQGHKLILHYKERMRTFFWQGDTRYFIYKVSRMK
jgi:hypothetical protein